jgi:hypothetical protein
MGDGRKGIKNTHQLLEKISMIKADMMGHSIK